MSNEDRSDGRRYSSIKSLILVNFNSIITDLVKIDFKMDDEDQTRFVIMSLIALIQEL